MRLESTPRRAIRAGIPEQDVSKTYARLIHFIADKLLMTAIALRFYAQSLQAREARK